MGAIISQGIINAGGRNTTVSMTTRDGSLRQTAVVGFVMFTQYWYWYPLLNFFSLTLAPTALIGLNKDLKVPKSFAFESKAKPSMYKYPDFLKLDDKDKKEKVTTAVLSTTAKVKARGDRKDKEDGKAPATTEGGMQVDDEAPAGDKLPEGTEEEKKAAEEAKLKEEEAKKPEPESQILNNPSRIIKDQEKKVEFNKEARWYPILDSRKSGMVILRDQNPASEVEELFYDDEERDPNAPNPDMQCDLELPAEFEFDPVV